MGRDKALLPYHGVTLVEHVAAQVAAAADTAALVGPAERYGFAGLPIIPDSISDFGPVAGIHAALQASSADWNLIVACDMPSVTAAFLRLLLEAAEQCGGGCLIPLSPAGRPEPLCAAYHRDCLAGIASALRENVRKVTDAVSRLRVRAWPVSDGAWFENLNTPEDLAIHRHA
jgi:molybdopterin-guanine dinucleotide biosynthesis protein A